MIDEKQPRGHPVGVTVWTLPSRGVRGLELAASLGFRTVHIDQLDLDDGVALMLEAAGACQIEIGGISLSSIETIGLTDQRRLHAQVQGLSCAARELKAKFVYVPSFGQALIEDEADLRATVHVLRSLLDHTEAFGPIVATENGLSIQRCVEILDRIRSCRCRILFDTQNPVMFGHEAANHARVLGRFVGPYVHLKDGVERLGDTPVGLGAAAVRRTVRILIAQGWRGTFVLETDYTTVGLGVAARDIRTASRLMREVA